MYFSGNTIYFHIRSQHPKATGENNYDMDCTALKPSLNLDNNRATCRAIVHCWDMTTQQVISLFYFCLLLPVERKSDKNLLYSISKSHLSKYIFVSCSQGYCELVSAC